MALRRLSLGFFLLLLASTLFSSVAFANATQVTINDLTNWVTGSAFGFDPNSLLIQQGYEAFDLHGEYLSATPPPVGTVIVVNVNFLESSAEPGSPKGSLSDSLSIVLSGITPFPGDLCNVSVDLHFRSDPYAVWLPNAFNIYENGLYQNMSSYIVANGGPNDLTVLVASDVPEPGSLILLGSGVLGLAGMLRRRWLM
jgi:hypothetical protein